MGYVPEEPHLYAHLTGLEYLTMVGQLRNLPAKRTAERIDGLLRLLYLHSDRHLPISSYSKGMRQKILLSAALMHNPDLVLLDEPFSGLDVGSALNQGVLPLEEPRQQNHNSACGSGRTARLYPTFLKQSELLAKEKILSDDGGARGKQQLYEREQPTFYKSLP